MQAEVLQILESPGYAEEIQRGAEILSAGKLIVLPTETVYGVAGVLTHADARQTLSDLRPPKSTRRAFTVHVSKPADAKKYLGDVSTLGQRLMRKLWPGPVGLIFGVSPKRQQEVAASLGIAGQDLYEDGAITLRCPDERVFQDIAARIAEPIALIAPPGMAQRVSDLPEDVLSRVEMVLDAGETRFSKPSTLLRITGDRYDVVRAGVYDERIIDRLLKTTILFVCSGNTCRSPMAEAIARHYLAQRLQVPDAELEDRGVEVTSAGSYAMPGARATPQAEQVLREMGLDLGHHRSRPLTVELIHQADFIFTMSQSHAQAVAAMVPGAAEKVTTLDPQSDIEDPIGGDLALYRSVAERIKGLIQQRLGDVVIP